MTVLPGSLESVRIALDDADREIARLFTEAPDPGGDQLLAAAYRARARSGGMWPS